MSADTKLLERLEDMSVNGRLRLWLQDDGDVIVAIMQDNGKMTDVEFCTPGAGGGGSPRTWAALRQLAVAMKEDNDDPRCVTRRVIR